MPSFAISQKVERSAISLLSKFLTMIGLIAFLTPTSFASESEITKQVANCHLAFEMSDKARAQHLRNKISANFGVPFDIRDFSDPYQNGQASTLAPYKISISKWVASTESEANLITHEVVHVTTSRRNSVGPSSLSMTRDSVVNAIARDMRFSTTNYEGLLPSYPAYRADEFEANYKQAVYRLNIEDKGKYAGGWPNQIESAKTFGYSQIDILSKFLKQINTLEIKVAADTAYPENSIAVEVRFKDETPLKVYLALPVKFLSSRDIHEVISELFVFRITYIKTRIDDLDRRMNKIRRSSSIY